MASGSMRKTMSLQRRADSSLSGEAWSKIRTFHAVFSREQFTWAWEEGEGKEGVRG